jgi:hypothetical protein
MIAPPEWYITYSGVATLGCFKLCVLLGELNSLDVTAAVDVGNAYLMAFTKEKLYIIAGPKLGDPKRCLLIIVKALYSLPTSWARWHDVLLRHS